MMTIASRESSVINMKRIISIATALVLAFSLVSCNKIVKMEYTEEGDLQAENGITYKYAPLGYEPTSQGEEYGLIKGVMEEKLYKIGELSEKEWLTTEYSGSATLVFYNADIVLPTLSELKCDTVFICEQDVNTYSVATVGGEESEDVDKDREIIKKLVDALCDTTAENEIWPRGDAKETFRLKMYSEDWPAIYYSLTYAVCSDGNFVYDRVTKRCVNVGELLTPYLENTVLGSEGE